jgi:putative membrane protein
MESLLIIPMLIVFYDLFKLIYNVFLQKKVKKFLLADFIMIIIFFMTFTIFILPNLLVHLVLYFISILVFVFINDINRRIYSVFIIIMTIIDMMLAWGSLYLLGIVSFIIFILFHVGIYLKIKERNEELNNYMYLALSLNEIAIILGSIAMLSLAS